MAEESKLNEDHGRKKQDDGDGNDFLCGLFSWRPTFLQRFAKPLYFTSVFILYGIFQGALKTGLNSSMTTIERKFGLSGKKISVVMIMDNVAGTLCSLIIGYYATKVSRPRILVFGVWMSIFACIFFVLPHFLYGGVQTTDAKGSVIIATKSHFTDFCHRPELSSLLNITTTARQQLHSHSHDGVSYVLPVIILFSLGNFFNGVGGTAFFIAGFTYADDNMRKKDSPVYFGCVMALRMIGPLLGVLVNSYFLRISEHPLSPPTGLTPQDPRFIGAWWIPFALWGALMSIVSLPLMLFPRHIRKEFAVIQKNAQANKPIPKSLCDKIRMDCQDFWLAIKRLSKNKVYMWKIVGYIFILNGLGGHMMNLPKYIESQYRVSASKASFLTGSTKVLAMIFAMVLGGVVIRIFRPSARTICLWAVFADLFNIAVLVVSIFLPCNNWRLFGTTTADDGSISLLNPCNQQCSCLNKFEPFCNVNLTRSYFSPCYAGCTGTNLTNMSCQCLGGSFTAPVSMAQQAYTFVSGFCPNDCNNLMVFILISTIAKFVSSLPRVGSMLVSLRCVDPADKALAIGFTNFAINVLAAVPYPLIYGALFDSTCLIWGERGGKRGNCWYFDSDTLRRRFLGTTSLFFSVGTLCFCMMAYYAKAVTNLYDEDDVDGDCKDYRTEHDPDEVKKIMPGSKEAATKASD